MAQRKNSTTSKRVSGKRKLVSPTESIPKPPPSEEEVALNVEISKAVGWRLKIALLHLEAGGRKTAKKQFVQEALIAALNRFDDEYQSGA
ncbi:hypothetical protein [Bythopirellula goksoeyrii]|uniref:Uncharacterized protein n=1 Tax=Bythopirellula goksoeyrii TaxID=1400387 RepID=A0A5B9QAK0_9BACT|nr:hypothetical protein [Bythopirellula goksoeyrii]QEG35908.1 hypothetical protein Pr1d_32150 [Bythopirellula goksoeyrii]